MKHNSALDEHIRSKLSEYSPEVPPHIWENIAAKKDKRRLPGFWWWLTGKTGLLIIGGVLLLSAGLWMNRTQFSTNNPDTTTGNIVHEQTQPVLQKEKILIPRSTEGNAPGNTTTIQDHANPVTAGIASTLMETSEKKAAASAKKENKKTSKQTTFFKQQAKTSATIISSETETEANDVEYISDAEENFLDKKLLFVDLLSAKNTSLSITRINIPCLQSPCPGSEKSSSMGKRYFEIYGGPDYAFRSMSDTGNSAYLEKRKESTTFSSAFSVGMRYTRVFNNGISFRTGLNYSQINEKFKYAQGNIIQVVFITNSNGDTTGSFATAGTRYKTTHNKYRTLDVPLLIGYEMGNERLRVNVNAGAVVNVYSWQRGDVLDTAFKPVDISTGKPSSPYQFRTNAGVGFLASASVYVKLNSRMHFLAEPYFRYNFSPVSKSELTFRQKYNTAGLRVGLRYDF